MQTLINVYLNLVNKKCLTGKFTKSSFRYTIKIYGTLLPPHYLKTYDFSGWLSIRNEIVHVSEKTVQISKMYIIVLVCICSLVIASEGGIEEHRSHVPPLKFWIVPICLVKNFVISNFFIKRVLP